MRLAIRITVMLALNLLGVGIPSLVLAMAAGGWTIVPVGSGSMSGAMEVGDIIAMRPVDTADVAVGDVVALPNPDGRGAPPIVHRVTAIHHLPDGGARVRAQGDGNTGPDRGSYRLGTEVMRATVTVPTHHLPGADAVAAWAQRTLAERPVISAG